jgi:hypothetical protein
VFHCSSESLLQPVFHQSGKQSEPQVFTPLFLNGWKAVFPVPAAVNGGITRAGFLHFPLFPAATTRRLPAGKLRPTVDLQVSRPFKSIPGIANWYGRHHRPCVYRWLSIVPLYHTGEPEQKGEHLADHLFTVFSCQFPVSSFQFPDLKKAQERKNSVGA